MKDVSIGKNKRGFSTLEILIAFAILSLSLVAVIGVVFSDQSLSVDTQTNIEAVSKAQAQIESMRALSRQNFALVQTVAPTQDGIYTKSVSVTTINTLSKQVVSQVSWLDGGRTLAVNFSAIFTNWQNGIKCSPTLSGDWTAPQIYGYVDFASSNGASAVDINDNKAYISSDPSSAGTDDFFVADVSTAGPGQGTLPTIGHFSTSYGLTDVHTSGNYAYVSADSQLFQLLIIDISNPSSLSPSSIVGKLDLTASGDAAVGNTLAYANNKVYLGLTVASKGPEFYVIDVSNPASPQMLGHYEVGNTVNHILIKNKIAYLTNASNDEVIALDVSDPTNPALVGKYTSSTLTGQSLATNNGTALYFGRIGGTGNPKLLYFDTTSLSTPVWSLDMSKQSGIYTLVLRKNLLFMTTADPNDGLQIWDVSAAGPSSPPVRYDTSPLNIQQSATAGTDCAGNLLFVAQRSNRAMQVIGHYVPNNYTLAASGNIAVTQGGSGSNTITATLVSGIPQSVTFSVSGLPAGATANLTPNSCTPSPTSCSTTLGITTTASTLAGTNQITVSGPGGKSTNFSLAVTQAFTYALSQGLANITLTRGGASVPQTVVVTMAAGATPQAVTLTPPSIAGQYVATPAIGSCTPSATAPYTCSVTFNYSSPATATKKNYNNQVVAGSPNSVQSNKFTIQVQ